MNLFRNLAARAETSVQDEEESLFVSEDVPPHVRYRSFQQRSSELGTLPETERHESRGLESSQGEGFSQDLDLEDMVRIYDPHTNPLFLNSLSIFQIITMLIIWVGFCRYA